MTRLSSITGGPFNKAAELYGSDDLIHTKIPRSKNQFEISFSMRSSTEEIKFGRVSQVSLPSYDFSLQPLNQYNRMRYYPTAARPQAFQIAFYDTRDSQFQFMLEEYAKFYSHGLQVEENNIFKYDTIQDTFDRTFGIKATGNQRERYFFDKITIKTIDVKTETGENSRTIDCYNCMIDTATHDSLDYATANPVMWQVAFQPEHVNIRSDGEISSSGTQSQVNQVFERIIGNNVYAVDSNNEFILDEFGNPVIIRTLETTTTATVTISEEGEVLVDETGIPL